MAGVFRDFMCVQFPFLLKDGLLKLFGNFIRDSFVKLLYFRRYDAFIYVQQQQKRLQYEKNRMEKCRQINVASSLVHACNDNDYHSCWLFEIKVVSSLDDLCTHSVNKWIFTTKQKHHA